MHWKGFTNVTQQILTDTELEKAVMELIRYTEVSSLWPQGVTADTALDIASVNL